MSAIWSSSTPSAPATAGGPPVRKASRFLRRPAGFGIHQRILRLYLTRYERWDSPRFLAGESYGTTRAAALSSYLLDHDGIDLNGIILLSTVLNFQTLDPADGNDLPYACTFPSYTAIALYHHKLETAEEDLLLNEVQQYALHDYLDALRAGRGDGRRGGATSWHIWPATPACRLS